MAGGGWGRGDNIGGCNTEGGQGARGWRGGGGGGCGVRGEV